MPGPMLMPAPMLTMRYPTYQLVPLLNTGRALAPPPLTWLAKVVVLASVMNPLAPAPAVAAAGKLANVVEVVTMVFAVTTLAPDMLP